MTRVVIVGAGIGGLTTALCLNRFGFDVLLCERSAALTAVGAGIQLGPNGTRVLVRLGLGDDLAKAGVKAELVEYRRWQDNRIVAERTRGELLEERFGAPHYDLYRPDLVDVLARRLRPGQVRFGARCVDVAVAKDGRAMVTFADGTVETADVVVGADGHHSQVRAATIGEVPARFSGMVAHRLLIPRSSLPVGPPPPARLWMGPHRLVMSYPVGHDYQFLNVVGVVPEPAWTMDSWTAPGDIAEFRANFADWSSELRELLDLAQEPVIRFALCDREPMARWSTGPITLLGDACHPMLPSLAQGGCQAIEDAIVLTRCLTDEALSVPEALRRYETLRLPRTSHIQRVAWPAFRS